MPLEHGIRASKDAFLKPAGFRITSPGFGKLVCFLQFAKADANPEDIGIGRRDGQSLWRPFDWGEVKKNKV